MNAPMLLAIDVGNSRVKWGWRGQDAWRSLHACTHAEFADAFALPYGPPHRTMVCTVASDTVARAVVSRVLVETPGVAVETFVPAVRAGGLENRYAAPTLGADRFAAAIGARARVPAGSLVVVSFGTATTIDTVTPDDAFVGGVIVPGLSMMLDTLARGTARLPLVEVAATPVAFPATTETAIAEGALRAQVATVVETWRLTCAAHGPATVVASGGALMALADRLRSALAAHSADVRTVLVDNLVLDGLARVSAPRP